MQEVENTMYLTKAQKIVLLSGLLIFVTGAYLTGGLFPQKLQEIKGDALYNWWLKSLLRDLGAALMVITIIVAGFRRVKTSGTSARRILFLCVGYGMIAFFLTLHGIAYVQSGKILQRLDFSEVIAGMEKVLEQKDLPETKRRVLLHKLAESLYLQTGEQIEVVTRDNNVVMFKPSKEVLRFKKHNDLSRQLTGWMKFQSRSSIIIWMGVALLSTLFGVFMPFKSFPESGRGAREPEQRLYTSETVNDRGAETAIDVLCVGHACYDLVFSLDNHPGADEKVFASALVACGGGPAANAAVAVSRLGCRSAFFGYLGNDIYGQKHLREFIHEQVVTRFIVRGESPTPLSSILVKPDGNRTVVNYKDDTDPLKYDSSDISMCRPRVMLFDGHEPDLSRHLVAYAHKQQIPTILDAGSVHQGTRELASQVDYLVAAWKFAQNLSGEKEPEKALSQLSGLAPAVVITLGEKGLVWQNKGTTGRMGAFPVHAVDTTGAGDAFHGAFAAGLAMGKSWPELLKYASAAAALTCSGFGARLAMPDAKKVEQLLNESEPVLR